MSERKRSNSSTNSILIIDQEENDQTIDSIIQKHNQDDNRHGINSSRPSCMDNNSRCKPNKFLTQEEKEEKRRLKKKLKTLQKINKLETRIKHAIQRNDPIVEEETRKELEAFCKDKDEFHTIDLCPSTDSNMSRNNGTQFYQESKEYQSAKGVILDVSRKLFAKFSQYDEEQIRIPTSGDNLGSQENKSNSSLHNSKEHQTNCAVTLLKNMTKGTVSLSMFDNEAALLGYTRQKFYERAMLLHTSMDKLRRTNCHEQRLELNCEQEEIRNRMWERIYGGHIRSSCSIGCGPGNDCIGLLTFLSNLHHVDDCTETSSTLHECGLKQMLMMDWSIQKWRTAVLEHLEPILKETNLIPKKFHDNDIFETYFCDVTMSYNSEENDQARIAIELATCDIFLTSYLLSETNGKWDSFFNGLILSAKEESVFYFAEPTPWQLHRLINQFSSLLDFLWVDSSMYYPSLQILDRRVGGPAILFAMKKKNVVFQISKNN